MKKDDKKIPAEFQRVWSVVDAIPPGCVASYGQVAKLSGLAGGARRVGRVLGKAPDRDALAWHRVVKADGRIALPEGSAGREEQIRRLEEEGVAVNQGQIKMRSFQWQPDMDELLWGPLAFTDSDGEYG
ncbi:MAG: MGMT family protein [Gammaproteobacteria bacterium]|nr:MGMT family protein [Gammaproteobacteria bacterium]